VVLGQSVRPSRWRLMRVVTSQRFYEPSDFIQFGVGNLIWRENRHEPQRRASLTPHLVPCVAPNAGAMAEPSPT